MHFFIGIFDQRTKGSDNKVLIKVKVGSCRVAPILQPLWSMPDKPAKGKVVLSEVVHHLHLLQALGAALPAGAGTAGVEDVEELGDVEVVVDGLEVAQQLSSACLADSTRGAMRWTWLCFCSRSSLRRLLLLW